jgi:hypothetical protein
MPITNKKIPYIPAKNRKTLLTTIIQPFIEVKDMIMQISEKKEREGGTPLLRETKKNQINPNIENTPKPPFTTSKLRE